MEPNPDMPDTPYEIVLDVLEDEIPPHYGFELEAMAERIVAALTDREL
jgi:hypothetical protein